MQMQHSALTYTARMTQKVRILPKQDYVAKYDTILHPSYKLRELCASEQNKTTLFSESLSGKYTNTNFLL